ncbi:EAL domain-containing protein [Litoribrevibacter albus]|uniref:Phosphodiesterase n=1 Tax=Litoribrevibacter albus TaxID=1473156 RepID=A0AA37W685_9GAMM|nr:EAL domain-containing protein [Litoribrevibacter albus]GLQ29654.1 phosphodiesterase [Litoribrevibacter albus]
MIDISLRNKILILFLSLIVISSITTIAAVLLATNNSVEQQAQDKLKVGLRVFEQIMDIRANQLFESAEVLTADFGFKAAVLDKDEQTLISVLENHGARIDADLMMLASLDGKLLASTEATTQETKSFPFTDLLSEARKEGGLMKTVMLNGKAYQMLMLQVNAPVPVAWAVIGFLIDRNLANQLKELTNLEVSFTAIYRDSQTLNISTLPLDKNHSSMTKEAWQRILWDDNEYLALLSPLVDGGYYQVNTILSTSLDEAFARFSPLKIQILSISGIALLISVIMGFFIARNVTRPVNTLVTAAQRISSGDYSEQIATGQYKYNEIGKLASSFDRMQHEIADREEKILYQAYHDALTGLANRSSAQHHVEEHLKHHQQVEQSFALVCINLQKFKQVNDTFGYQIGDQLLQAFAQKLEEISPPECTPARLGGDEFLLVLNDINEDTLSDELETVLDALNTNYCIASLEIPVSVRLGASIYPEHGFRTDQLLRRADIALNAAKAKELSASIYEQGSEEKHLHQIRLVDDLKIAISEDQLTMFYQPKVDLHQKRVTQVESLIRWFHPELGFIAPDEFIGLAEQSGLMPSLSRWVIRNVLNDCMDWKSQGFELVMAVNISAYDLAHDDLPDYVFGLLKELKLKPDDLILEVTESAVMQDPKQALMILTRFREQGIKLAIDDYGTGYSSLSQLKSLPVDELKIDMSFVLKLDQNKDDQAIVQSTIEMGHCLGLNIVAEGVESRESWALLEGYGCDKLQGYYISKPQNSANFIQWFKDYDVVNEYSQELS